MIVIWSQQRLCAIKNRNVYDNLASKKALLLDIEENLRSGTHLPYDLSTSSYVSKPVPKTFHGVTPPNIEIMIQQKKSRMK